MVNNDNILRPSALDNVASGSRINPQSTPELRQLIQTIVDNVVGTTGREMISAMINSQDETATAVDQVIDAEHAGQLEGLDKIPDVVRSLREFSGKAGEFSSWRKSVDRVLTIYESKKGTPMYYGILSVIRNKIIGNADVALESYNTPLDWKAISKCLTLHYADKRDLSTLEYQMTSLVQRNNTTVEEFYQEVYTHLSLILYKLSCLEVGQEALHLLTQTYRDKALDTFVRGLRGDLSRLLGMKEPSDLPQALHLCLKLENQSFRTTYANNVSGNHRRNEYHSAPPNLPPRRPQPFNNYNSRIPFYPQLAHIPRTYNPIFQNRNQYPNNRNFGQNFQPRGFNQGFRPKFEPRSNPPPIPTAPKPHERMEVDTVLTGRVNYANRPNFQQKRFGDNRVHGPTKMQRNFHVETQRSEPDYEEGEIDEQDIIEQTYVNFLGRKSHHYHTANAETEMVRY